MHCHRSWGGCGWADSSRAPQIGEGPRPHLAKLTFTTTHPCFLAARLCDMTPDLPAGQGH